MNYNLKRIGILTGGGDCPGLNAVIRSIAKPAMTKYNSTVIGILDGFEGLVEGRMRELTPSDVGGMPRLHMLPAVAGEEADPVGRKEPERRSGQCLHARGAAVEAIGERREIFGKPEGIARARVQIIGELGHLLLGEIYQRSKEQKKIEV